MAKKPASKNIAVPNGKNMENRTQNNTKIHPIVIYPYVHSKDTRDIEVLYKNLIKNLSENSGLYSRPITVMNRQTFYNNSLWIRSQELNETFQQFREDCVEKYSTVIDAWCVDTCQMWLAGFGKAFDHKNSEGDVYWLIPGDFNYSTDIGKKVLEEMKQLPFVVQNHEQDICVGEIQVDINSSKQLIDTYGTYGLLYNWFPHQAQKIRKITDKPRTEFLAISHSFLRDVLRQRWYAYEQTIIILLQAIIGRKRIDKIRLGNISDLPQGKDTLAAAMQQVERTERVLKLFWREMYQHEADWAERFKKYDVQSGQIRGSALVILGNLLKQ